ncbi:MAG: nicotinate-nucleotide adenylyltransferase [candidate division WS1 bacterium]|jgi:nicotinate-nucleotide adenylyltransferase|nr:nicotinate-nucleotide adenylyltransferase [candidate division WS1 bacterium]
MAPRLTAQAAALRVGLMGGTFDPPHYGHLALAEAAREALELERVIFLPNGQPPHKPAWEVSPAEHRYAMTELACASHPHFFVSRAEMDRPGPSYSLDTVRAFQRELGPDLRLYFIVGMDSVVELPTWHEPDRLLEEAQVVAADRPGSESPDLEAILGAERRAKVQLIRMAPLGISGTDLRERVRAGRSLWYLTPEPVAAYIEKHGLYRQGEKNAQG